MSKLWPKQFALEKLWFSQKPNTFCVRRAGDYNSRAGWAHRTTIRVRGNQLKYNYRAGWTQRSTILVRVAIDKTLIFRWKSVSLVRGAVGGEVVRAGSRQRLANGQISDKYAAHLTAPALPFARFHKQGTHKQQLQHGNSERGGPPEPSDRRMPLQL